MQPVPGKTRQVAVDAGINWILLPISNVKRYPACLITVRTVTENSRTLKLDNFGFEEE